MSLLLKGAYISALLPVLAILNYLIFFGDSLIEALRGRGQQVQHRYSRQTIHFKKAAKEAPAEDRLSSQVLCLPRTAPTPTTPTWVPVLLQVRRLPLLLYGPHQQPRPRDRGVGRGSAPGPRQGRCPCIRQPLKRLDPKLFSLTPIQRAWGAPIIIGAGVKKESFRSSLLQKACGFQGQSPWAHPQGAKLLMIRKAQEGRPNSVWS